LGKKLSGYFKDMAYFSGWSFREESKIMMECISKYVGHDGGMIIVSLKENAS